MQVSARSAFGRVSSAYHFALAPLTPAGRSGRSFPLKCFCPLWGKHFRCRYLHPSVEKRGGEARFPDGRVPPTPAFSSNPFSALSGTGLVLRFIIYYLLLFIGFSAQPFENCDDISAISADRMGRMFRKQPYAV